jgi:hypothetical protein
MLSSQGTTSTSFPSLKAVAREAAALQHTRSSLPAGRMCMHPQVLHGMQAMMEPAVPVLLASVRQVSVCNMHSRQLQWMSR